MSLFARLQDALLPRPAEGCAPCQHFCTDPARLELQMPGLASLSSAHASVRAGDGLCLAHQRLINGRRRCEEYA